MIMFERWWAVFERQIDRDTYAGNESHVRRAVARCAHREALEWVRAMFNANMENKMPVFNVEEEIKAELLS